MKTIPDEVLFDIDMEVYMKYNSKIATAYDHLGDYYSIQDIKDMEEAKEQYRQKLIEDYLKGTKRYKPKDIDKIKQYLGDI